MSDARAAAERFGIAERSYASIIEAIEQQPEIERAVVFGSRAMGNAKRGSDIDIALFGAEVTSSTAKRLSLLLNEELPIPYYIDVVAYSYLEHEGLKHHIDTLGRELFRRDG